MVSVDFQLAPASSSSIWEMEAGGAALERLLLVTTQGLDKRQIVNPKKRRRLSPRRLLGHTVWCVVVTLIRIRERDILLGTEDEDDRVAKKMT